MKDFLAQWNSQILTGEGRILPQKTLEDEKLTKSQPSIWATPLPLQCQDWCKIHFDDPL